MRKRGLGGIFSIAFIALSVAVYKSENGWLSFVLGLLACVAVLMLAVDVREMKPLNSIAAYTMPVFLMHTLFAAPARTMLMKIGMNNPVIHVVIGIIISFIGPVVAMKILQLIKLDWLVYPGRLLKNKLRKHA